MGGSRGREGLGVFNFLINFLINFYFNENRSGNSHLLFVRCHEKV